MWHHLRVVGVITLVGAGMVLAAEKDAGNRAVSRGIDFLVRDAVAWKNQYRCASCHHASLVVWALAEAKTRGYSVPEPFLPELMHWIADSGDGTTSVPRPPGIPKALNAKAVQFALALAADPSPDAASRASLEVLAGTIRRDQTENGSWAAWPETRPPFFGPSNEAMSSLASLALVASAQRGQADSKAALERGLAWLERSTDDDAQSIAIRLVLARRIGRPPARWQPLVQRILDRQRPDGGWSQSPEMASDAWATGQALYALGHLDPGVQLVALGRGREFLIRSQRPDGSWPMTSRPAKAGGGPSKSLVPITGGGSAWAVLGLVRTNGRSAEIALPR